MSLPIERQLEVAKTLVRENRLSITPNELIAAFSNAGSCLLVDIRDNVNCLGFKLPTEGFTKIAERLGLRGPLIEKGWTLRTGSDQSAFRQTNADLLSDLAGVNPGFSIIARMRADNKRGLLFNIKSGFIPVGSYTDSVNGHVYLLTKFIPKEIK